MYANLRKNYTVNQARSAAGDGHCSRAHYYVVRQYFYKRALQDFARRIHTIGDRPAIASPPSHDPRHAGPRRPHDDATRGMGRGGGKDRIVVCVCVCAPAVNVVRIRSPNTEHARCPGAENIYLPIAYIIL